MCIDPRPQPPAHSFSLPPSPGFPRREKLAFPLPTLSILGGHSFVDILIRHPFRENGRIPQMRQMGHSGGIVPVGRRDSHSGGPTWIPREGVVSNSLFHYSPPFITTTILPNSFHSYPVPIHPSSQDPHHPVSSEKAGTGKAFEDSEREREKEANSMACEGTRGRERERRMYSVLRQWQKEKEGRRGKETAGGNIIIQPSHPNGEEERNSVVMVAVRGGSGVRHLSRSIHQAVIQ